jgi:Predicted solute binding protein
VVRLKSNTTTTTPPPHPSTITTTTTTTTNNNNNNNSTTTTTTIATIKTAVETSSCTCTESSDPWFREMFHTVLVKAPDSCEFQLIATL